MKSVMKHSFGRVTPPSVPRSQFNRSSGHKTTIDADYIYPVFVDEVIPGDTFNMRASMFARMSTPIYPIMDNLYLDTFFFFVPYRLLWTNYHKFLGAQDDPGDSIDFTVPVIDTGTGGAVEDTIYDYFGIPDVDDVDISAFPLRAYNLIWNEWFRDENLQDSLDIDKTNGPDTTSYALQKRGKRYDYFTSCLPWPQKGNTAVSMPLGTSAPINVDSASNGAIGIYSTNASDWISMDTDGTAGGHVVTDEASTLTEGQSMYADLSNATAATINAIRLAVTTQQFLERDARGGTRINEIIQSHFGVVPPDYRVQRPEYLGGSSTPITMNTVPQTSGGSDDSAATPQGTLAAYGTMFTNEPGFNKSFTEFGLVIGLVNVRADLTYQQGIERFWRKSTRYDFYWPDFANIGEQSVLYSEIYAANDAAGTNDDVWGYQERYAEYRYKPSRVSGAFRSGHSSTLDPWILSEELSSPALDSTFIPSNTPMDRVEAVSSEPDFILDCYFDLRCVRPMPLYATPGIARF
jgi:hypothetical protein